MGASGTSTAFGRLDPRARTSTHGLAMFVVVWLGYAAGSRTAYSWFNADGLGATFFPAAGVTVAALLLTRPRWWPVVLLAAASAEFTLDLIHDLSPGAAAGYTLANTVEPLVAASLVRSVTHTPDLRRTQDLAAFVLGAVIAAPAIGSAIGATTFDLTEEGNWGAFAGDWWVGDGLGVLVIGGAILATAPLFAGEPLRNLIAGRSPVEAAGSLLVTMAMTAVAFWTELFALLFVPIGLVLVIAFRYGTLCVALAGAGTAMIAASATADGHVFTAGIETDGGDNILYLQLTLAFAIGTMLFLSAALRGRDEATADLASAERRGSLLDITTALASARTVADVVDAYVRHGRAPLAAKAAMIAVAEGEELQPMLTVGADDGSRWSMVRWEGPVGDALRTGRRVSVENARELRARYPDRAPSLLAEHFVAVAAVPLPAVAEADPGAAGVAYTHPHRLSEREWQTLESLADATAQALARVRLIEAERLALRRSEVLRQLSTALARALTVEQVGREFLDRALEQFGAAAGALMLRSDHNEHLDLAVMSGSEEICGRWRDRLPLEPQYTASAAYLARAPVQAFGPDFGERFPATAERIGEVSNGMVALPLGGPEDEPLGSFGIAFEDGSVLTTGDLGLLEAMAAACVPALARARLTETTERRRQLADELQRLATAMHGESRHGEIAEKVAEHARSLLGTEHTVLALYDRERDTIRARLGSAASDQDQALWSEYPATMRTPIADAIRAGEPLVITSRAELLDRYPELAEMAAGSPLCSTVVMPVAEGSRAGALAVAWTEDRKPGPELIETIRSVAARCAAPLEQARRTIEQERARGRAELIATVMSELEAVRGVRARATRLVELLVPAVADYATVEAPDNRTRVVAAVHSDPKMLPVLLELREQHALERGKPDAVANIAGGGGAHLIEEITPERVDAAATGDRARDLLHRLATRSHIAVPLTIGSDRGAQTVLMLGITDPERRLYREHDLTFCRELAERAAIAIESARLLEEEHATAVRLQEALLPDRLAIADQILIAARYRGADERLQVGGDWYESLELPDGRIALAVGDIVGHGLEAAAGMGQLRTGFAALAPRCTSPAELLDELDTFAENIPAAAGSTVVCCFLDPARGTLAYACAGHPPPVLVEDGEARLLEGGRSWPLASPVRGHQRGGDELHLSAGAMLVLYSDGLVERRGERLTTGLERLRSSAVAHADADPHGFCEQVMEDLAPTGGLADDVVVLAARVLSAPVVVFERSFAPDPAQLAPVRQELRSWMAAAGIAEEDAQRLLLAVGEACANAIEHGNADGGIDGAEVELLITEIGRGDLRVTVADKGTWQAPSDNPDRGLGTPIMRRVSHEFIRTTGDDGTRIAMRFLVRQEGGR